MRDNRVNTELFNSVLNQLTALGRPKEKEIDYVAMLGFSQQHWEVLQQITIDDKELYQADDENKFYATIHAGCALFQLDALAATPILISQFYKSDVYDDDWIDVYMMLIASVGAETLPFIYSAISHYLEQKQEHAACQLVEAVGKIAKQENSQIQATIIPRAEAWLANYQLQPEFFNSMVMGILISCKAVDSIALIRQAFEADKIDVSYIGDIEDVEIELGLRTQRDTPKPNYFWQSMPKDLDEESKEDFLSRIDMFLQPAKTHPMDSNYQLPIKRAETKIGRNDPCPCGSGKKYKKCCLAN